MSKLTPLPVTFPRFGVDNMAPVVAKGYLRQADNVDILPASIHRRYAMRHLPLLEGKAHSLWATQDVLYVAVDEALCMLVGDVVTIIYAFASIRPLTYMLYNDYVYVSNGDELIRVQAGVAMKVTLPKPDAPIVYPYGGGNLTPATYWVSVTFVNDVTNEEGAASDPIPVVLTDTGSIVVNVQYVPQGCFARVYLSLADSDLMYDTQQAITPGVAALLSVTPKGKSLDTRGCAPLPAGTQLSWSGGRILSVVNNTLYFSEPLYPHVYDAAFGFLTFGKIHFVERVDSNDIYVGDDSGVWYVDNMSNPREATIKLVSPYPPLSNSTRVPTNVFDKRRQDMLNTKYVAAWLTSCGYMYGSPNGIVTPATPQTINVSGILNGTAKIALVTQHGCPQLVSLTDKQVI